jgi:hypothetical protein
MISKSLKDLARSTDAYHGAFSRGQPVWKIAAGV